MVTIRHPPACQIVRPELTCQMVLPTSTIRAAVPGRLAMLGILMLLLLGLASCSETKMAVPETATGSSTISESERQAIMLELRKSFDTTTGIGEIRRLSVDTFLVDVRQVEHLVCLREDGIATEGDFTRSEIKAIKEQANRQRKRPQYDITSIKQTSPDTVEVTTGDFGTAGGEVILFQQIDSEWRFKSIGRWIE